MKRGIMILMLFTGFAGKAQALKDLLYSGKLKSDSNTVVKKTDALSTKIDTTQKKADQAKVIATPATDSAKRAGSQTAITDAVKVDSVATVVNTTAVPKNNNKIWKDFTDSLVKAMQADVLSSKKTRKDNYYVTVDYEADVNGQVNVTNVTVLPENAYLQDQVKQRLSLTPPQLTPVVDSTNKTRKVKRKYNFTITKE
ncbi:MAG: hypothetical protein C4330_05415 [Chitinophagaceae bacterium]